jgi:hypothetical protein
LLLTNIISCKDEFLDKQPLDQFAEGAVWTDPALMQSFVNNIYLGIPHGYYGIMLSSAADESMAVWDFESSNITKGQIDPSYNGLWDETHWTGGRFKNMSWANGYKNIRACNLFLEKVQTAPFEDQELKDRLTGEVYFLRAYLYHNLVSLYGGVPIITKAYGLNEDYQVTRESFENCVKFISEDCDKAAALLPLNHDGTNKGRATKGAALALKSRTLVYAASDLYHNTSWAGGFSNPELIGYVGGDRMARWQAAKDAAKAVMDLGIYSLHKENPGPSDSIAQNYAEIFLQKSTSEDIFIGYFLQKTDQGWDNYNPGLYNGPNGYHNWGGNTPIGQLADDYEMRDGTRFSWGNPAHAAKPYQNRDPRFYATILYEGAKWRKRPADVVEKDPEGIIQVGFYEKPDGTVVPGLDTRKSPVEDWNGTYTGYYLKKFMDPTVDAQYFKQDIPWRFIRYTEVLLNYAEACLGLGQEAEARTYINMIRKRAGMPETNESGQDLINRYRNERRVEMAFEDQRYFDIRRWMIAPQVYTDALGVEIRDKMMANGKIARTPTFKVIEVQDRAWLNRGYFLPIKLDEMNRNNKLIQNPLYQ